jgi:diguanylate cyclase (GGDEF)-like protein
VGALHPRLLTPVTRAGLTALATATAVYLAYVLLGFGTGDDALDGLVNDWLQNALLLAGATLVAVRAVRVPESRAAWAALAVALLCWSAGQVLWSARYAGMEDAPYPSWSDALWLAAYPLYYASLVLLAHERLLRFQRSLWLDGLIGTLAAGALGAALLFAPLSASTGGPMAAVATTLAYPLADLLLLAIVLGVFALSGWHPGPTWTLIGAGFVLNVLADTAYTYQAAIGTFREGTWIDAVFVVSLLTLAMAAWQRPRPVPLVRLEGLRVLVPPMAAAVVAIGLLALDVLVPGDLDGLAEALVLATLLAVVVRCFLTFRENAALLGERELAITDDLTGLRNRRGLDAAAEDVLAGAGEGEPRALLLLDVDRFKDINDTLGHPAGDRLLVELAERLKRALGGALAVGRLGGDEFVALIAGDDEDAVAAAERVQAAFEAPVPLAGLDVPVRASIGIAVAPGHGRTREELLRHAGVAMHRAKQAGSEVELYQPSEDSNTRERLELAGELRGPSPGASSSCTTSPRPTWPRPS